ncbi:hypothetical protein [Desulfoscipio geothermicus]|uniref:Uncharacterized protein n=1 Tax=Desulfoscipio geothermicus DSM 3669 TaxID=1121426 RepID=A0A1I6DUQ4_9FIRM|nr:hypothetical protein [Desulfoscipio geothermicus]SFR09156.1 hypothetical protein SAMN05660706_11819 [Desulfoscipio geothermicus DSM 3669]
MKNWKTKVLSIVLGLSVLAPTASFAADTVTATQDMPVRKGFAHYQRFDVDQRTAAMDKMLDMVGKYTPGDVEDWKNAFAEREQLMSELKEKAPVQRQRPQISDEIREKVEAIREGVKNGTITREQAGEELKNLGLDRVRQNKQNPRLSDEVKEKVKAIREDVKNGKLTREQAAEELKSLGLQGKKNFAGHNNLMIQFNKAVKADDESAIKELLPQLLEQLKEKNQQLSVRLSETN